MSDSRQPMSLQHESRILYIISCYSGVSVGNGGHYYSLREISTTISKFIPGTRVEILVLGDLFPSPLKGLDVPVTHINFIGSLPTTFLKRIMLFGKEFNPTHVHCFDNKSYFFGWLIADATNAKRFLTKPGGPNPKFFFPYCPSIICFSQENQQYLCSLPRLKGARIELLPQRVSKPTVYIERISRLRELVGDGPVILRICRIGRYYEQSIRQTVNLVRALKSSDFEVSAVIVGTPESTEALAAFKEYAGDDAMFVTDISFTHLAASLLPIAIGVVGTGRNLIEAALLDIPVFTPIHGNELPTLVTIENLEQLAKTNFSERNSLPNSPPSLADAKRALLERDISACRVIQRDYSLHSALPKYREIYSCPQRMPRRLGDFLINSLSAVVPYALTLASHAKRSAWASLFRQRITDDL